MTGEKLNAHVLCPLDGLSLWYVWPLTGQERYKLVPLRHWRLHLRHCSYAVSAFSWMNSPVKHVFCLPCSYIRILIHILSCHLYAQFMLLPNEGKMWIHIVNSITRTSEQLWLWFWCSIMKGRLGKCLHSNCVLSSYRFFFFQVINQQISSVS